MSDGITHLTFNLCCTAALSIAAISYGTEDFSKGVIIGGLISTIITPDFDLSKSLPRNIAKRIPFMELLWRPYARMFKHRSFWTHSFIISSLIRISYFLVTITPILLILYYFNINPYALELLLGITLAWIINDASHLFLDGVLWR